MVVMPTAEYGHIFEPADVAALFAKADVSLSASVDHASVAARLDTITADFLLANEALATGTPGELAEWAREVEARTLELLACFAQTSDHTDPLDAADRVLRGPTGVDARGVALHLRVTLGETVNHLRKLARRANHAAGEYEARKGHARQPAWLEIRFYELLGEVFEAATGRKWGVSTAGNGNRTGPGIRFCMAVGRHVEARRPVGNLFRDDALQAALRRLQSSNATAERIRDTKPGRGGSVRKR